MTRQTGIDAYRRIRDEGLLPCMRWRVYRWLYKHGPATGREVNQGLGIPHAHVRLHELQRQGVAEEVGVMICSVTGFEVLAWDVTDSLPHEPFRRFVRRVICCPSCGSVERLFV